jgi:fructose-1,6-bisphosphatase/inositol monophosphatase family enzyme
MFYGREENIDTFIASVRYMAWGGDCYNYGLLAGGWLDIVIEAQMNFYDFAALVPVVEGAGGFIGDWAGNPLRADSDGSVIALGDKDLLNDALKALS